MAEIAEPAGVHRASIKDAADAHASVLPPLADISAVQWRALSERAAEPNGYYLPDWELAVDASARGRVGAGNGVLLLGDVAAQLADHALHRAAGLAH